MNKIIFLLIAYSICVYSQNLYGVYAIEFAGTDEKVSAVTVAYGGNEVNSVQTSFFIWLLVGENGKKILVDAGYTRRIVSVNKYYANYIRPDSALLEIGISPNDISDIIITHPYWDHIGGIKLFKKAKLWMQRVDYYYFVGDAWQAGGNNLVFIKGNVIEILKENLNDRLNLIDGDSLEIIPGIWVFTGEKHTFKNQYVRVFTRIHTGKIESVIITSDACWYYYNWGNNPSVTLCFCKKEYVENLRRMKRLVNNSKFIIPGHDKRVMELFEKVSKNIVRIL